MEDDSEEGYCCAKCEEDFDEEDLYDCDLCGNWICMDCGVQFEPEEKDEVFVCKECIDKEYPREEKIKEVIKYVSKESTENKIGENYFD